MIKASDIAVRNRFCDCSSRSVYYETKGHAISAFDNALSGFGYRLADEVGNGYAGNEGRAYVDVVDGKGIVSGCAVLVWYRMPSGRYEFTGYLA